MDILSIITQLYEQMNQDEKLEFLKYSKGEKAKPSKNHISIDLNLKIEKYPHCSSEKIVKNGHKVLDALQKDELMHIRISKGKYTNGSFNIQTINNYYSELKRLVIGNFKDVATKYLNNYIVYHNVANFAKGSFTNKLSILTNFVF